MTFTRVDYTCPVISFHEPDSGYVNTETLGTRLTLWYCDECGALVVDQPVHKEWHAKQTFFPRIRRRLRLGVASHSAREVGTKST